MKLPKAAGRVVEDTIQDNADIFLMAFEAYAYAEELDPADGGIKLNLALTHYQRGRLKESSEKYREAVGLNKSLAGQYQGFEKLLMK